jgi:carboxyl-terminal processing protease
MKKVILSVLGIFILSTTITAQIKLSKGAEKVGLIMYFIENYYVDQVNDKKLSEDAIRSLLRELDPHSSYISPEEAKEMNEPLEGNFDGIGISFNMMTDTLYVIETISGGPSEKVGILPGDKMIYVNDTLIAGVNMSTKKVMTYLRGPKGTKVNVKVKRGNVPELIDFVITRDKIPIYSLDAAYMLDNNVGYVRLSRFGATTLDEFKEACKKLQDEGMESLILDLQSNGGGYMPIAIGLVDEFLDRDKLIVYTEGRREPKKTWKSTSKGLFEQGKLIILINEYSASASEIVSGAIQDWDRGVIVGRRSFGKGLVQKQVPLPDESLLRLTVSRYYTPTGRSIQKPYEKGDEMSYAMDVIERYNKGEMMHADSIHFPDSLKYQTLVNKRTVYGGGGIMPDYFVPVDTSFYSDYIRKINAVGVTPKTALRIVDKQRASLLTQYPTSDSFNEFYDISDTELELLKSIAQEDKIEFDEKGYEKSLSVIKAQLKALIARDLYDGAAYYKVINQINDEYLEAVKIINDDFLYNNLLHRKISEE